VFIADEALWADAAAALARQIAIAIVLAAHSKTAESFAGKCVF